MERTLCAVVLEYVPSCSDNVFLKASRNDVRLGGHLVSQTMTTNDQGIRVVGSIVSLKKVFLK